MLIRLKAMHQISKKRYKQSLFIIPYLFTYLNAIFGFLSILKASEADYITAAYYIILAAFMDGFDGRLARALGSSSCFGMELDSLCDAISFCVAPTVLIYYWIPDPIALPGKLILAFYVCAGLARLAKFNITADKQQQEFIGLPTTIAAFFISSLVLYDSWIASHSWKLLLNKPILFSLICCIAFLMVSSIRFYSFKRYKMSFPRDYPKLLGIVLLFSWAIAHGYPLPFFILSGYIVGNVIKSLYVYIQDKANALL
jgi:CDP-diacylglycerol---serine O-phosphatidyltransferase